MRSNVDETEGGAGTVHDHDHDHDHDYEHDHDHDHDHEHVGPYRLLERIGAGGMGVVRRGWDPRLERAVAIKLLRPGPRGAGRDSQAARQRLVREAQALARFSHPNVVQVFDVGTEGDTVWVAMELVEGATLGRWRKDAPRSTTEILRAFSAAGRGLAAAHAQGLVHRDFKPDNVFVGFDGRVCVGDFGLVRATASTSARAGSREHAPNLVHRDSASAADLATALTGDGLVLGTPAYMAPEQHYGERTDARTDQYAFCVALWEALYEVRPFTGKSASELAEAKRERRLLRPETSARVSAAVHRAIVRGLHPEPQHRFAAMEPLIAVIDRAASARAPRLLLVGLGVAALAGAFVIAGQGSPTSACEAAEERVRGVWNPARRSATAAAFEATDLPYAGDTWGRVEPALDRWADTWATTHGEVCIASRDGAQSQAELDARMRCLDGALARFDGVLDAFEHADRDVAVAAAMSVRALPAASACATRPATESERLPDDPARARRVAELVARLRRHTGAAGAGALTDVVADAERLLAEATAVGWDPLTAEVERAVGQAYERAAQFDAATEHMQAALHLASAAGDDRVAAEAATDLVWLAGRHLSDVETAERWLPHAVAAVERLGDRPLHVAKLLNAEGLLAGLAGRVDDACTHYEEAHRLYAQELGPEHPDTLTAITNLGAMEMQRGAYGRARDLHASVLRSLEGIYGPLHPEIAIALINLANARTRLGDLADATDDIERAIRIRRDALGEEHPEVATALNNLGAIQEARGMYQDAERTHRAALRIFRATLPADHPNIGASMTNVGSSLERQGKLDAAIAELQGGRAILADALPPEHPYLAYTDVSLGAALRGAARLHDAQEALDRARAACDRGTIEPGLCALVDFERARLSWDARPASRGEAHASAAAALRTLEETPFAVARQHLDEMRAWVSAHDSAG